MEERRTREPLGAAAVLFKVEPCTHYYLGAQRNSAAATDWSLVVNSKERVADCSVEDELRKAGHPGSISGVMPAASAPK